MPDTPDAPATPPLDTATRLLRIRGRVQGVGYRAAARAEALRLGLAGWVRNRADGSVEALARGPAASLDRFEKWCRHGPPAARVDDVTADAPPLLAEEPAPMPFEQRPTL